MQEVFIRPAHPVEFGFGPEPLGFGDRRLCSPSLLVPSGDGLYSAHPVDFGFGPSPLGFGDHRLYSPNLLPFTASPTRASPRGATSPSAPFSSGSAATEQYRQRKARLAQQYQDAANRYRLCVSQLGDAAGEAADLHTGNIGLAGQLGQMHAMPAPPMLPMARPASQATPIARPGSQAPPMLRRMARPASRAEKLAVLPKSISIRSTGYTTNGGNGKHRVTTPVNVGTQYVDMDGGTKPVEQKGRDREKGQVVKSVGGLEFEVYNQGMFKTELCNKWQETGACSYGDQCQFAHGIAELRPVIRHPRYKTQVCRMVLGGALCPHGHRCHFRHSITPADHHLGV